MSIVHALLLGLLGGIGIWDSRIGGMWMLDRPLVLGPIVGLILGDFKTGIIVGGSLELIMMGIVELVLLHHLIQFLVQFWQQHLQLYLS